MIDFLKESMHPSSIRVILMLLTPGVVLTNVRSLSAWGRRWVSAVVVLYWVLSCPITVDVLARTLTRGYAMLESAEPARQAKVVVMLGAGTKNLRFLGQQLSFVSIPSGLRALETARLFKLMDRPLVIASGGVTDKNPVGAPESDAYEPALVELGVPADRILQESRSKNTHDEAVEIKDMLRERGLTEFVLVTSPLHMRRSMSVFEAQGMHPIPAVAPLHPDSGGQPFPLLPNDAALDTGDQVVYEWVARGYYWWKGWL
jgi:uncharacterized SAM-binding protein YcdF (DUF218 family)